MPTPPENIEFFDKVNYVIDAWARPCDAPWYIYVAMLKPAALAAFITLLTFGWDDVARGYFRPRGLGAGRRTGKKGKRGAAARGIPELGEMFGENLPGADEVKGKKWGIAGKALWRIDTQMQQGLFWWLVADVTNDFAFNFTSTLYETRWCAASNNGRFSYQTQIWQTKPGNGWWRLSFEIEDYEFVPPSWLFVSGLSGPTGCLAAAAIDFRKNPIWPAPTSTAVRIVERHTSKVFAITGPEFTKPDGSNEIPVSGMIPPNTRWEVEIWHDAPWADAGMGVVTAMQE